MNWKGFVTKRSWPNFRYYLGISLEGLRKTTKTLIRIAGRRFRDLNPGPHEYRSRVSSGIIVSDYGLDDRAIGVQSAAGGKGFFL
jgi:hypothetical protein